MVQKILKRGNIDSKFGSKLTPVRPDRDDFIRVIEENIEEEMRNKFVKRSYDYDYLYEYQVAGGFSGIQMQTPYDVRSVNSVRKETVFKSFKF